MTNRSRKQAKVPQGRVIAAAASDPVGSKFDIDVDAGTGIEANTEQTTELSGVVDNPAVAAIAGGAAPSPSSARRRRRRRSHQGHGQSLWTPTATKFVIITAAFVALTGLLYVLVHLVL